MLVRRALGDPEDEKFVQQALKYFLGLLPPAQTDNTRVYDGVREALASIRQSPQRATSANKSCSNASPQSIACDSEGLNLVGVLRPDRQVVTASARPRLTPRREVAGRDGISSRGNVMVGDSSNDVLTVPQCRPHDGGRYHVGFAPQSLELTPPDVLVDSPQELAEIFLRAWAVRSLQFPCKSLLVARGPGGTHQHHAPCRLFALRVQLRNYTSFLNFGFLGTLPEVKHIMSISLQSPTLIAVLAVSCPVSMSPLKCRS